MTPTVQPGGTMHGDYVLPDGTVRCYRDGRLVYRSRLYRLWVRISHKLRGVKS